MTSRDGEMLTLPRLGSHPALRLCQQPPGKIFLIDDPPVMESIISSSNDDIGCLSHGQLLADQAKPSHTAIQAPSRRCQVCPVLRVESGYTAAVRSVR